MNKYSNPNEENKTEEPLEQLILSPTRTQDNVAVFEFPAKPQKAVVVANGVEQVLNVHKGLLIFPK